MANITWTGNSPNNPPNPVGIYSDTFNWDGFVVPVLADTAIFGSSSKFLVVLQAAHLVGEWRFTTALSYAFTINVGASILFAGVGVTTTSGAAAPTIANAGTLDFSVSSSARRAEITNSAILSFHQQSTAGQATITNDSQDATLNFFGDSTAANATIVTEGEVRFSDTSTAGNADITNTNGRGKISFADDSDAGSATLSMNVFATVRFAGNSSAANSTIDLPTSSYLSFSETSTAGSSSIKVGASLLFFDEATAGSATIENPNTIEFNESSTAGNAVIENDGYLEFDDSSSGGNAHIVNVGEVTFDLLTGKTTTLGALSGSGLLTLGETKLTLGSRGLSTTFAGIVSGDGGSLVKVGAGKFVLSGQNTYTGGSTVSAGILQVDGKIGAATVKNGATLAGKGVVGAVTVETGGTLSPGASAGKLSTGSLVLKGKLTVELGGATAGTQYDQVKVTGTVNLTGSTLTATLTGGFQPSKTTSQTFVVIDNDGTDAVTGTFASGPGLSGSVKEGASVVFSGRFFEVSYKGGTGNDVTLTSLGISGGGGTSGNNTIGGSAFDDVLLGLGGNDKLSALAGNDRVQGDAGNDTLDGGDGTDTAVNGSVAWKDLLVTKSGSTYTVKDLRSGSPLGTDTLTNIERISIGGKESSIANALRVAPTATKMSDKTATEGVAFSFDASRHFADKNEALGDVLKYAIVAGPAWLKINAVTGVLSGKPGINDQSIRKVTVSATDSQGAKVSTSFGLTVKDVVTLIVGDSKSQTIKGTVSTDHILGKGGNDRLEGEAGNDTLEGGTGNDTLVGGAGVDRLVGNGGKDTASYELSASRVTASLKKPADNKGDAKGDTYKSIENLTGSARGDKLAGDDADNAIKGLGGNDTLTGLRGKDTLTGGNGADKFVFKTLTDSRTKADGRDLITDFVRKDNDVIDLSAIDARSASSRDDDFSFIGKKAFSGKAGELRYEAGGKKTFVYGDVDGDGKADFAIELTGKIDFAKADFNL